MSLSTSSILNSTVRMVERLHRDFPAKHLDVGSGNGELIAQLRAKFPVQSSGVDYTDHLMNIPDVTVAIANLNDQGLPFQDSTFDLVTCTEVIEHLEHYRYTIREMFRVLKPGGTLVISTPNILNLKSRIRFLILGFYNLFGPLHFRQSELHTTGGHINPISYFFLVHALVDAGFNGIELAIDKKQSTSIALIPLFYLPIKLLSALAMRKEVKKYQTIDSLNMPFVKAINSPKILLGRTIVVGCKKPDFTH